MNDNVVTNINWFPGHMAKTRRMIAEHLSEVDLVIELLDARIPYSSRNPEISRLCAGKPMLTLLNKADLADPVQNALWVKEYSGEDHLCLLTDCAKGTGLKTILPSVRGILREKVERYEQKGMNRALKAMVLGIPNVGKSSFINRVAGSAKAKAENRPGVTTTKQWVRTSIGLDLLDMPGVLWPKFEDTRVGENLAITGAIRDRILDLETIASALCLRLREGYPADFSARYKLGDPADYANDTGYDLLRRVGRKRGFLVSGGEVDTERTAAMLLEEFRSAKIGKITLDRINPARGE